MIKSDSKPVIEISGLDHFFGDGSNRKQVLFGNSIRIHRGELVIMTGPSGSGKTTLLTLIGALRSTQSGSNRVFGTELLGLPKRKLVEIRRRIGFIFQMHNLFESLTSIRNVRMAMELQSYTRSQLKEMPVEILTKLGLGERIRFKPRQLSGGQRQRVAIARALVNRPKLILADKPTAALDKESSRDVVDMLKQLTEEDGCTILMVTHDSRILDVADRIVNMVDGRIESDVVVSESIQICEVLQKSEVFSGMSAGELLNIAEKMQREDFAASECIIRQGDEGDKFYIIADGMVDVHINLDEQGTQTKIVDSMSGGGFFGEKALMTGEPRNASIITTADTTTYSLGKDDFQEAISLSDSFQQQLRKVAFRR